MSVVIRVTASNLNRDQAKAAMREGKKLRHRFFMREEWVTEVKVGDHHEIVDQDGVTLSYSMFWLHRQDAEWNRAWQIIEEILA